MTYLYAKLERVVHSKIAWTNKGSTQAQRVRTHTHTHIEREREREREAEDHHMNKY